MNDGYKKEDDLKALASEFKVDEYSRFGKKQVDKTVDQRYL